MRHYASRGLLAVLSAFIAVTTVAGAIFVVPTLPPEWIADSVFSDYTIPALALGLVGVVAIVTLLLVVVRPANAGLLAAVTGVAMVVFELVEIWAVGFSLVDYGLDEPFAWLQAAYIAIGALTAIAGLALWRATADERERHARTSPMPGTVHR